MSSRPKSPKPYKISTATLATSSFTHKSHPIDPRVKKHAFSLGDATGLTQLGVHLSRVGANTLSTALHWHTTDDEWIYVVEATPGARLLIREDADDAAAITREEEIAAGDFLAFPAGDKRAHALRAGDGELVYLVGGTRAGTDVCSYPEAGMKAIIDKTGAGESWAVHTKNIVKRS
jgi:uncharacterized cupin superfamily protein